MMFSLSFVVFLLINFGINGQTNDINPIRANNQEKGYAFGKLRLAEEGKNEELIPTDADLSLLNQDQSPSVQPLPSPCSGTRTLTKIAHPKDKTKYIQCRDEFHYEILTCPNGGEYNAQTNSCDLIIPMIDRCLQEKPCLNDGQCSILGNSSFKCTCRQDWTGEKCETPLTSCVKKPCGPNADCRSLKTSDYEQDYVCVCHGPKGYGLNCQEVVPNPCLTSGEQFFQYAFSQRSYIQCDGELIYFQPCGPLLFWNQEQKICDRKRPPKIDLPALLAKIKTNLNDDKHEEKEIIAEEITTTLPTEQLSSYNQKGHDAIEGMFAFVPARTANRQQLQVERQQLQADLNAQKTILSQHAREIEKKAQELANHLSQSIDTSHIGEDFASNTQQWPNVKIEANGRQPFTIQSGRNQLPSQNVQQEWTPTLTDSSFVSTNFGQSNFNQDNQQQNFPQQNQVFGSQQSFNQLPDINTQNNQQFGAQPQSRQGSRTFLSQLRFQDQNQPNLPETTTVSPNVIQLQGFHKSNIREQDQSTQNRPTIQFSESQSSQSTGFNTQNSQTFDPQPQSWQTSQTIQNQPRLQEQNQQTFIEPNTPTQKVIRLQGFQKSNVREQDESTQNRPTIQFSESQSPQTTGFNAQPQSWQTSQTIQNQPRLQEQNQQTFIEPNTPTQNIIRLQGFQKSNVREQDQSTQNRPTIQFTESQSPQTTGFNAQPQSWQTSQTSQNQPRLQEQNQQAFIETTTPTQNIIRLQGFQKSNVREQEQSTQNRPTIQFTESQSPQSTRFNTPNTQTFIPQSQSWQTSQTIQNQPRPQEQNQQAFIETTTPTQNVGRFPSLQQTFIETTTPSQNIIRLQGFQAPREQDQSWQNRPNTQFTGTQFPQSSSFNTQNSQILLPKSQSGQDSQSFQNIQKSSEGSSVDNENRLNPRLQQNNQFGIEKQTLQSQPPWQIKGNAPIRQNVLQPESSLFDNQRVPLNNDNTLVGQTVQNQQRLPMFNSESSTDLNKGGIQTQIRQDNQQQNFPQQNQIFGTQQWSNKLPDIKTQTNQRFGVQPQPWQGSQTIQNEQSFIETTTTAQNIIRSQGFQNQISQDQDQSYQTKFPNQLTQIDPSKLQSNPIFAFQPKHRTGETSKQNQQDNVLTSQTYSTNNDQPSLINNPSSQIQTNQFGFNQQQKVLPIQNSFEKKQPWQINQQFQSQDNILTDSDDSKIQPSQNFASRPVISFQSQPSSQTGQLISNSYDSPTLANKAPTWQTVDQRQQNQIIQPTDQRKPLDAVPTLSGSWRTRAY